MHDSGEYSLEKEARGSNVLSARYSGSVRCGPTYAIDWQIVQGVDGAYACIPSVLRCTRFPVITSFVLPPCEVRPDSSMDFQLPSSSSFRME